MPKNHFSVSLIIITLLSVFAASAHAEIYKWVDDHGMTHYSDGAPAGNQSQVLNYGHLRRPNAPLNRPSTPRYEAPEAKINFPGEPLRAKRYVAPAKPARIKRRAAAPQQTRARRKDHASPRQRAKRKIITTQRPTAKNQPRRSRTPRVRRQATISNSQKTSRISAPPIQQPELPAFKEFELIENPVEETTVVPDVKPDLDAVEYDMRKLTKLAKKKPIINIKKKLCSDQRMLLAALQEKGFSAYYDEAGHYRLAWGGDGIYQGKRRYLTEDEIAKKTKDVKFKVAQYCDNPDDLEQQKTARANWIRAEYCAVSKAVLEDLEHPFMRSTDSRIAQQKKEVKQLCGELKPNQYRDNDNYYPTALRARVVMPRHLTLLEEEEAPIATDYSPGETLNQLLALIE